MRFERATARTCLIALVAVLGAVPGAAAQVALTSSGQPLNDLVGRGVALADLNGDGDLDVFLACIGPDEVWVNDGRGQFTDSGLRLGGAAWSWELAVGDLDRDGLPDVFVVKMGLERTPEQTLAACPADVWLNTSRRSPAPAKTGRPGGPGETRMKTIRMEEMTWPAIRAAVTAGYSTVVAAVGSTEQHGPHLPTMTDARIGDAVAERVARRLKNALVARTIDVGVSEHHLAFGGTISLKPATLEAVLGDYVDSLARSGFRRILFLPTHGANFPVVASAIGKASAAHPGVEVGGFTDLFAFVQILNEASAAHGVSAEASGAHAGESETSIMLALEPGLVSREHFAPGYLGPLGPAEAARIVERGMPDLTANGVLGDPSRARAEWGAGYLDRLADFLAARLGAGREP